MKQTFFDPAVWEQVWQNDGQTAINKMKAAGIDPTHSFDHKAVSFNEQVFNEEGRRRSKRIMNWLEDQGVRFQGASILDIGAASGGFTVPFVERGAQVTAVEPCLPLVELLERNIAGLPSGQVEVVTVPFEHIDVQAKGWEKAFDLVFISMCPIITDWESVEKVLRCARQFCYISLSVGSRAHSLLSEIWPLVTDRLLSNEHLEMAYLQQLLLLKGYSFGSLVTREMKTTVLSREEAFQEVIDGLNMFRLPVGERERQIVTDYLASRYPSGDVEVRQGGRFGKVLIRLQQENMYARE